MIHTGWALQVAGYASCRRLALVVSKILKHQDATSRLGDHCRLPPCRSRKAIRKIIAHDGKKFARLRLERDGWVVAKDR
jgi:hypothetical protein